MKLFNFFGWLIVVLVLLFFSLSFIGYNIYVFDMVDYCQSQGWDGFLMGWKGHVCFMDVSHSSGVGVERVYSGVIE